VDFCSTALDSDLGAFNLLEGVEGDLGGKLLLFPYLGLMTLGGAYMLLGAY